MVRPRKSPLRIVLILSLMAIRPLVLQPASAGVTTDGSLGAAQALTGPDYTVASDLGSMSGANLFHSFGEFSLTAGESATFSGPASVENVISRVTGGDPSNIDGLIRSEMVDANLFFINPSGVLFGPNAALDVGGSFHVSTANLVRFGGDGVFYADREAASILTSSPPLAFGFLGDSPAGISIDQSTLAVPEGKTLSVVGGDVSITGVEGGFWGHIELAAPGGRIEVVSAAASGEIAVAPGFAAAAPSVMGSVSITDSGYLDSGGNGGGTVVIRGGQIYVESAAVHAAVVGDPTANSGEPGEGVTLQGTESVVLSVGSELTSNVGEWQSGDSGPVVVEADRVTVEGGAVIRSRAYQGSTGQAGGVQLRGEEVIVTGGSLIEVAAQGGSKPGEVRIEAERVEFSDRGNVSTFTWIGTGDGGDIVVSAGELVMEGTGDPNAWPPTGLVAQSYSSGAGGDVTVNAQNLTLSGGAKIQSYPASTGAGGDIRIETQNLLIAERSWILSATAGAGDSGTVSLKADRVDILEGAGIFTHNFSGAGGRAGDVIVDAGDVSITGYESAIDPFNTNSTGIKTISGYAGGDAGNLTITADTLTLENRAVLDTSSYGPGRGGDISLQVGQLAVRSGSPIIASAFGTADAGDIAVLAATVEITGVHPESLTDITGATMRSPSGISAQSGVNGGSGGTIRLTAEELELSDGGRITTETFGNGDGGNIQLEVGLVSITGENEILKEFLGAGHAEGARSGILSSAVNLLGVDSTAPGGEIQLQADTLSLTNNAWMSSRTETSGPGGTVIVSSGNVSVTEGAEISATSVGAHAGAGPAGIIELTAANQITIDHASISSASTEGAGGLVSLEAGWIEVREGGVVSAEVFGAGDGGSVELTAGNVFTSDGGVVTSSAVVSRGGDITVAAPTIQLINGAVVLAESAGPGAAGSVTLTAGNAFESQGSTVSTEAQQADGGDIAIEAGAAVELTGSEVTASASGGTGRGGTIRITTGNLTLTDSVVSASTASTGRGGDVDVDATWVGIGSGSSVNVRSTGEGAAGSVTVAGEQITLTAGGEITAEASGAGDGGAIQLMADKLFTSDAGVVTSSAQLSEGGDITITAPTIRLRDGALVLAESAGLGDAGSVTLLAGSTLESRNSSISTEALEADGGNIWIQADTMIYLVDSQVTASVGGGAETTGGNVTIDPEFVILKNSQIVANAYEGTGGNIQITTGVFLADPDSRVDASSQLGVDGNVDIRAVVSNISGVLTPLPEDFRSAADLLRESCLARAERGTRSSMVLGGRDAVPPQPGQFLPSPVW